MGLTSSRGNYGNNTSGVDYKMQIEGTGATSSSLALIRNSNDANDGGIILGKTRSTSVGGNTVVQAGDDIGTLSFVGADGTSLQFGADIGAEVESGVGNDDMPTHYISRLMQVRHLPQKECVSNLVATWLLAPLVQVVNFMFIHKSLCSHKFWCST